jgi:hypothetical protein
VAGSFNVPPTQIIAGTNFDTLVWTGSLGFGTNELTFTWQSALTDLQPGEARAVTGDTAVNFTDQGTPGTLHLPQQVVSSAQILGLSPPAHTAVPGTAAGYVVSVQNPTANPITYTLSVQGVPPGWVDLAARVTVAANDSADVPLTLTSDVFARLADYGFTVTAEADTGFVGTVRGTLTLAGTPAQPDPEAHGGVVSLDTTRASAGQGTPAIPYTVRLTNTGSATDNFAVAVTGLPPGVAVTLSQAAVDVPPGASNFREIRLVLTPAVGTPPGDYSFQVTANSTTHAAVSGETAGVLAVARNGVHVTLNPSSGAPGAPFQLTVTNTGQLTDTFDLSLAGPAALVASLASGQVTLAPGASRVVPVATTAVNFAVPGSLALTAVAASHANPAVRDAASGQLTIASTQGMTAELDPPSRMLPALGTASLVLLVHNTGNTEDAYSATITGTSGPITASLLGLDGQPTPAIPVFRLPGLSTGAILLQVTLAGMQEGTVTILVRSLSNPAVTATVTATVTVCGPDPAARPAVRFVQEVYCDLFMRALDANGMARWPVLLDAGLPPSQVVTRILGSEPVLEYRHDQVQELYARLLHRPANATELANGTAFLQGGGPIEQLTALLAGSAEYFRQSGGTTDGFLAALYQDLLGRTADASGRAHFRRQLVGGTSRETVATAVLGSDEYRGNLVRQLYQQYLHRPAGATEVAKRVAALRQGQRTEDLLTAVLGSAEYYRRAVSVGPDEPPRDVATPYVTALYRQVLRREPDAGGLAHWVQFLNHGGTREAVVRGFWESAEHRGLQVDQLYATYLHHPADAQSRVLWVNQLRAGLSEADVTQAILLSPEYAAAHATPAAFVAGLYGDVLGRAGDAGGTARWVAQLSGGGNRADVARAFLASPEAQRRAVDAYYQDFLHRPADAGGEAAWLSALAKRRLSTGQVAEALLASEEFFARVASIP